MGVGERRAQLVVAVELGETEQLVFDLCDVVLSAAMAKRASAYAVMRVSVMGPGFLTQFAEPTWAMYASISSWWVVSSRFAATTFSAAPSDSRDSSAVMSDTA